MGDQVGGYREVMAGALRARQQTVGELYGRLQDQAPELAAVAALLLTALRGGRKVLVAGNGGSAAEAQHFAAELVGRYRRERKAYPAIALTADTSILTAIGNDYGYENVFARQVEGLGQEGDVLLAFSTSGRSRNLLEAAAVAREQGMPVVSITGEAPNPLAEQADLALRAPTAETPLVQEIHMLYTHLVCDLIEAELAADETRV